MFRNAVEVVVGELVVESQQFVHPLRRIGIDRVGAVLQVGFVFGDLALGDLFVPFRSLGVMQRITQGAAVQVGVGEVGVEFDGPGVVALGAFEIAQAGFEHGTQVIDLDIAGGVERHAVEVVECAVVIADLGAEKFFDIKCRMAGLKPDAVVLVATIRALKYNGGVPKDELSSENLDALKAGIVNLEKHIENLHKFGVPVVVTLNSFVTDTKAETDFVEQFCKERGCEFALSEVWEKGGEGGIDLANKVLETIEHKESNFKVLYDDSLSLKEKIETVAKEIYGADGVTYSPAAERELKRITDLGMGDFPICMAKTQYSLSDDAKKLGRPSGFKINVREVYASAGAGFVVAVNGSIMTMPGLSKKPAAYGIDVDDNGVITGLF